MHIYMSVCVYIYIFQVQKHPTQRLINLNIHLHADRFSNHEFFIFWKFEGDHHFWEWGNLISNHGFPNHGFRQNVTTWDLSFLCVLGVSVMRSFAFSLFQFQIHRQPWCINNIQLNNRKIVSIKMNFQRYVHVFGYIYIFPKDIFL